MSLGTLVCKLPGGSGTLRERSSERRLEGSRTLPQVRVIVTLKPSLLDAQGRVVQDALHALGYGEVGEVRIGKYMELRVETPAGSEGGAIDARVKEMCDRLLANPVIEDYRYEVLS
jgi:phosphoribosylformylglycinamidine synthase